MAASSKLIIFCLRRKIYQLKTSLLNIPDLADDVLIDVDNDQKIVSPISFAFVIDRLGMDESHNLKAVRKWLTKISAVTKSNCIEWGPWIGQASSSSAPYREIPVRVEYFYVIKFQFQHQFRDLGHTVSHEAKLN